MVRVRRINIKVAWVVIADVPIQMMDNFTSLKAAAQLLVHFNPVDWRVTSGIARATGADQITELAFRVDTLEGIALTVKRGPALP